MHLQNLNSIIQSGDMSAGTTPFAVYNIRKTMPALLAALDAAEAAQDRALAEELVTKLYELMDLMARLPDRDPA